MKKIQLKINGNGLLRLITFLTIFTCTMGAKFCSIDFIWGKLSPFRILIATVFFLIIIKRRVSLCSKSNEYSVVFMSAWFLYSFISVVWSNDINTWLKAVFFIFIGWMSSIIFINTLTNIEDIEKALLFMNFGIVVQSILGWYEIITLDYRYLTIEPELLYAYKQSVLGFDGGVPIGMCGNPNDFATLMFLGILLSYILRKRCASKIVSLLYLICQISFIVQIYISSSRAALLGTALAIFFIICLDLRNFFIVIKGGIIVLTFSVLLNINFLKTHFLFFDFSNSNGSDSVRLNLIKNGMVFLVRTFGIGTGAGQIESWMSGKAVYYVSHYTNMHNWWIEILTAYGILIFCAYMLFYVKLFLNLYNNYNKNKIVKNSDTDSYAFRFRYTSLGMCAVMVGYIFTGISSSSNMSSEYMWIFWSICIAHQGIIGKERHRMACCRDFINDGENEKIGK